MMSLVAVFVIITIVLSVTMMFVMSLDMLKETLPRFQLYRRWYGGTWKYDRIYGWKPQQDESEEENWG